MSRFELTTYGRSTGILFLEGVVALPMMTTYRVLSARQVPFQHTARYRVPQNLRYSCLCLDAIVTLLTADCGAATVTLASKFSLVHTSAPVVAFRAYTALS
jgi:hypothetical protein